MGHVARISLFLFLVWLFPASEAWSQIDLRNLQPRAPLVPRSIPQLYPLNVRNGTDLPMHVLRIDGLNLLTNDLQPGQTRGVQASVGTHTIEAAVWSPAEGGVEAYRWRMTVSVSFPGKTVTLTTPTIREVMADYRTSATWTAWDESDIPFRRIDAVFSSSGGVQFFSDGQLFASGSYAEISRNSSELLRTFSVSTNMGNANGTVDEIYLRFDMNLGGLNLVFRLQE